MEFVCVVLVWDTAAACLQPPAQHVAAETPQPYFFSNFARRTAGRIGHLSQWSLRPPTAPEPLKHQTPMQRRSHLIEHICTCATSLCVFIPLLQAHLSDGIFSHWSIAQFCWNANWGVCARVQQVCIYTHTHTTTYTGCINLNPYCVLGSISTINTHLYSIIEIGDVLMWPWAAVCTCGRSHLHVRHFVSTWIKHAETSDGTHIHTRARAHTCVVADVGRIWCRVHWESCVSLLETAWWESKVGMCVSCIQMSPTILWYVR